MNRWMDDGGVLTPRVHAQILHVHTEKKETSFSSGSLFKHEQPSVCVRSSEVSQQFCQDSYSNRRRSSTAAEMV